MNINEALPFIDAALRDKGLDPAKIDTRKREMAAQVLVNKIKSQQQVRGIWALIAIGAVLALILLVVP